jgi:hypothetical protein
MLGLNIAKHVSQLHGVDEQGSVVLRRRLRRDEVVPSIVDNSPYRKYAPFVRLSYRNLR